MGYHLELAPKAQRQLDDLPYGVLDCFESAMERLAGDPAGVSEPGAPPYRIDRMYFPFSCDHFDGEWQFLVAFQYAADEETLLICSINAYTP